MKYQIYIKGEPISPAPNTYWASRKMAEDCIPVYEREAPGLKDKLEVRPIPQSKEEEVDGLQNIRSPRQARRRTAAL